MLLDIALQENWYASSFDSVILIFLGLVKFSFLKLPKFMGYGLWSYQMQVT